MSSEEIDEGLRDNVKTLIPSLKRIYKTQEEILQQGMQKGLRPHQEKMKRSMLHTLQGMTIGGSRIKTLMNTDKHHQGERKECKEGSQDILQAEDEDDHDYQDNDDEGDNLYHQVYEDNDDEDKDTYHQNCQIDRHESDQEGLIETAPQVLATYHTSPGREIIRYKIKRSMTVQMIDKNITYNDETIDIPEQ